MECGTMPPIEIIVYVVVYAFTMGGLVWAHSRTKK